MAGELDVGQLHDREAEDKEQDGRNDKSAEGSGLVVVVVSGAGHCVWGVALGVGDGGFHELIVLADLANHVEALGDLSKNSVHAV